MFFVFSIFSVELDDDTTYCKFENTYLLVKLIYLLLLKQKNQKNEPYLALLAIIIAATFCAVCVICVTTLIVILILKPQSKQHNCHRYEKLYITFFVFSQTESVVDCQLQESVYSTIIHPNEHLIVQRAPKQCDHTPKQCRPRRKTVLRRAPRAPNATRWSKTWRIIAKFDTTMYKTVVVVCAPSRLQLLWRSRRTSI